MVHVPFHNGFITLLCNYLCGMGYMCISFDEILVSLGSCITKLKHPINKNYVFNYKISICRDVCQNLLQSPCTKYSLWFHQSTVRTGKTWIGQWFIAQVEQYLKGKLMFT